jgi:serine/tyrosine/threonine adenylyltransferase
VLQSFITQVNTNFLDAMGRKIGFATTQDGDVELVRRLLTTMHAAAADFTLTFRRLTDAVDSDDDGALLAAFGENPDFPLWLSDWRQRLGRDPQPAADRAASMRRVNPAFIPRNHRVEAALNAASDTDDMAPFLRLLAVLQRPYDDQPENAEYAQPPQPAERVLNTFCGT